MQCDSSLDRPFKVVVIGASTGGIPALKHILSTLPSGFGAAVAVVQHRNPMGQGLLAEVLARSCILPPKDAEHGEPLRPGMVFIAPSDKHLVAGAGGVLFLDHSDKIHAVRPSAEKLFTSAAQSFKSRVIAVVLSGADHDGQEGVQMIKQMGGTVIAQNKETAEMFDMPRAAIKTGVVDYVLPITSIGPALVRLVGTDN